MDISLDGAEELAFWREVRAVLDSRAEAMTAGPRAAAELEQAIGVTPGAIRGRIARARGIPLYGEWPSVEAVVNGLNHAPTPGRVVTIAQLVDLSAVLTAAGVGR